jgi:hypothetical protein
LSVRGARCRPASAVADFMVMKEALVEARLGDLELQIAEETRALDDLRRRTHTLEVEIAGWKPERLPAPAPRVLSTEAVELALGGFLGVFLGFVAKMLVLTVLGGN